MKKIYLSVLMLSILSACGGEAVYPTRVRGEAQAVYGKHDKAFGEDGLDIFSDEEEKQNIGIGVNAFLWRATLDVVSFMPVASADPFGGVILTDWKTSLKDEGYRYKLNIYILDKQLRADGVKVSVFKQKRDENGQWQDVDIDDAMATQIEDSILTKARELKIQEVKAN
ncbi:MAG: DUF3576 domain-containing protein [Alphaproteobacteria bacterium]|jgi:hypothetical protein|nr:DUF3576 domain-containing protein [Alphaproteobacteria bacterium]